MVSFLVRWGARALLLGAAAAAVSWALSRTVGVPVGGPGAPGPDEWVGVLHVHTRASDGSGTAEEIAAVARDQRLDFVVVADHNLDRVPPTRYVDGVLTVGAVEVSTEAGHVVVLGVDRDWSGMRRRPVDDVLSLAADARLSPPWRGGPMRWISHPYGPNPWRRWDLETPEGMELWNADTEWRNDGVLDWIEALALLPWRPDAAMLALVDRPSSNLDRFDAERLRRGRVAAPAADDPGFFGVCSVDAHARIRITRARAIRFPSYALTFSLVRQHVWLEGAPTGDPAGDEARLLNALREGRGYCSVGALADARGFRVRVESGAESGGPGDRFTWAEGASLRVTLPEAGADARTTLYRDGEPVATVEGRAPDFPLAGPGDYRVEVELPAPLIRRRWSPWILSGPVRMTGEP